MKKTMKKLVAVLLVMTLAIGAAQGGTAEAASKALKKADVKNFSGKNKKLMKSLKKAKTASYCGSTISDSMYDSRWGICYAKHVSKKSIKILKTKRGISLYSTKQQVFQKYGKSSLRKYTHQVNMTQDDFSDTPKSLNKFLKKCKYCSYSAGVGGNYYVLHFFFNNKNRVTAIGITKNMD